MLIGFAWTDQFVHVSDETPPNYNSSAWAFQHWLEKVFQVAQALAPEAALGFGSGCSLSSWQSWGDVDNQTPLEHASDWPISSLEKSCGRQAYSSPDHSLVHMDLHFYVSPCRLPYHSRSVQALAMSHLLVACALPLSNALEDSPEGFLVERSFRWIGYDVNYHPEQAHA